MIELLAMIARSYKPGAEAAVHNKTCIVLIQANILAKLVYLHPFNYLSRLHAMVSFQVDMTNGWHQAKLLPVIE